ncbi:MAG: hypothetical protein KAJ67_05320, partial [Gemmatimonadetes bacterium]|nr:hypothetical protein [Gemmatimonadota bacterium]
MARRGLRPPRRGPLPGRCGAKPHRCVAKPRRYSHRRCGQPVLALLLASASALTAACGGERPLVVGSKNFTEQSILGELVAGWIERTTTIPVRRRLHLGGTFIAHQALIGGQIDLYVEYTGTA